MELAELRRTSHGAAVMSAFPKGKLRLLYVLALAQLVGGPLVLLQVTLFCKLTLHEAPRVGMAEAAVRAWHSNEFQAAILTGDRTRTGETKSSPPSRDPKVKPEHVKPPVIPWQADRLALVLSCVDCESPHCERVWTPQWPQAPPGPPPRVG